MHYDANVYITPFRQLLPCIHLSSQLLFSSSISFHNTQTTYLRSKARYIYTLKMTVIEIKDRAHYQDLINNNKVVIIDAWAPWCGPCRFISPIFEQLSEREEFNKSGVVFAKVDVDQAEDVSQELGIRAMPTFISFYDGELQDKLQGADPSGLEKLVQEVTSKV